MNFYFSFSNLCSHFSINFFYLRLFTHGLYLIKEKKQPLFQLFQINFFFKDTSVLFLLLSFILSVHDVRYRFQLLSFWVWWNFFGPSHPFLFFYFFFFFLSKMAGIWRCSKPDDFSFKNVNFKRLFIIVLAGQALSLLITGKLLFYLLIIWRIFNLRPLKFYLIAPRSFFSFKFLLKNHEKPFIFLFYFTIKQYNIII